MFEVITQANPDDYQSLEILKEAYWKTGRQDEGLGVTRRLADTYMRLGQYSSALLEYEGILQQKPDSPDIAGILEELEGKLHQNSKGASKAGAIALDFGIEGLLDELEQAQEQERIRMMEAQLPSFQSPLPADLMAIPRTELPRTEAPQHHHVSFDTDGNEPLAKFLIQHRLASHETVDLALLRVQEINSQNRRAAEAGQESLNVAASLLDEIGKSGVDIETLISGIIDRTKFAFVPLDCYEVDRQIVRMLPEILTLGHLIVPFDIVSRTMMVAIDNPFDSGAKAAVQQAVDYHIQWYLAHPSVIQKILRDVYKITA